MKKLIMLGLVAVNLALGSARGVDFGDIQNWTGTGANEAALVIDWNDGQSAESLLWGFRWNGTATGLDMFQAVVEADPRLYANITVFSFGTAVTGIGYDLNGNNVFGVSPTLTFDAGGLSTGPSIDTRVATDAGDHWSEGFNLSYWGYYNRDSAAAAWGYASSGAGDRVLVNGTWDGYSFSPGFNDTDPSNPIAAAPVPEPATVTLCLTGGVLLISVRMRNNRRRAGLVPVRARKCRYQLN